ncbi:cytochrome P450 family protein [Allokutzneria oryzae]|uniref:Cytochrome P450 n=1 Tax=Allokutzneria oryzae TaxID=1378989 RepID=A0ABV6A582_9PSEU
MPVDATTPRVSGATLFTDEYLQNSHEVLALLRADGPVHRARTANGLHAWVVTRYDDARAALADDVGLLKNPEGLTAAIRANLDDPERGLTFSADIAHHMLNSDGADHARLRGLVGAVFTAERIERLRPGIIRIADELLDAMAGKRRVDLIDEYALLLPVAVICELLGVPRQDRDRFRSWSNSILGAADPDATRDASIALAAYLVQLIRGKAAMPGEDLLSALLTAGEEQDRLSEIELISMVFLLLVAGHETAGNLIGNGVLALLREPGQLAALRADPSLLPRAVEELLRFDGPVAMTTLRYTAKPVTIGGVDIPRGEIVFIALTSANRDGARFTDPDRLDITRPVSEHIAFGHGMHRCLGAPLARIEGEVAIGRLLARFPELRLDARDGEIRWRRSTLMHGLHALPVAPGAPAT